MRIAITPIAPIIEAAAGQWILRLKVDPAVRDNLVAYHRLQRMLAAVCRVSEIQPRDIETHGYDLELFGTPPEPWNPAAGPTRDLEWATTVELNKRLSELTLHPVIHFQASQKLEQCFLVVVDFRLQSYHAWHLQKELEEYDVLYVTISPQPEYGGRRLVIYAPGILAAQLESRVREFFSRELYDI